MTFPARETWTTLRPGGPGMLLVERESELSAIEASIRSAISGHGGAVVVEGQAGIGKSSLLGEAGRRASAAGMTVLTAQGAALEQDFGFGVVRQLFEPVIRGAGAAQRRSLLSGAAALAAPTVAPDDESDAPPSQQAAIVHGLYWLTAALAEQASVLLEVDDAQWADVPSLRFLAHLVRRIEGIALLVTIAIRTGDAPADAAALAEILATPGVHLLRPAALSASGVARLMQGRLGEAAHPSFVEACRMASGGVPYLVGELVTALEVDRVPPTAEAAARVAETGSRTVANATMLRLSRVSSAASEVARAAAVWGPHARFDRVARLACLGPEDTQAAMDALIGMGVLAPRQPACFAHPLVLQAIYDDLPPTSRAAAHGQAAGILASEGAPVDEIAAHLLLSEPMGQGDVVATLRRAAGQALARGAPQGAVAYLRRALAEGVAEIDRAVVLRDLGRAEALAQDAGAAAHLEGALELLDAPVERARALFELSEVYLLSGQWTRRLELLRNALDMITGLDPDLESRLEAARSGSELYDPAFAETVEPRLVRLRALADEGTPGSRTLALVLAAVGAFRGMDRAEVLALVERGLDSGGLLRDEGSESLALPQAMAALIGLDEVAMAARATAGVLDDAQRRGSVGGFIAGSAYRLATEAHRGDVKSAETDLRTAVELSVAHGLTFMLPGIVCFGTDVLLERPDLDDIASLLSSIELEPALAGTASGAWLTAARGRLRSQCGAREEAAQDLRAAGRIFERLGFRNPILALWRSPLALALPPEAAEEARSLVNQELRDAMAAGLARSRGVALRAAGCLEGGARGVELLERSLAELHRDDAVLERARTLVELGGVLRRSNQKIASRGPLLAGLDLAHRCGAECLAARATAELRASGARPRRHAVSGPDALTSSEARVAHMAADGMSNREIAQSLFVTAKTVENQLGSAYRKLGVRSRERLRSALVQQ
jgi:DNA-binding CsgD family transcriptional regulator